MHCQKCKSERIVQINAKCRDMCDFSIGGGIFADCYVPSDLGIGSGDYLDFEYCADCGQIQGDFPLLKTDLEKTEEDILDDEND